MLYGLSQLLYITALTGISSTVIVGLLLTAYGIVGVFINIGKSRRSWLLLANLLFFTGLFFLISDYYQIIEKDHLFFTLFLFVLANGSLLLFIENTKEKIFLILSFLFFVLSISAGEVVTLLAGFSTFSNIGLALLVYWPVFLILFGVAVLVHRRK